MSIQEAFGDPNVTSAEQIGKMAHRLEEIAADMGKAKDEDTARYATLKAEQVQVASDLTTLKAKHDADLRETEVKAALDMAAEWKKQLSSVREPSKARSLGDRFAHDGYVKGSFLGSVYDSASRDFERQTEAKAVLKALTSFDDPVKSGFSKSTLATTDATGGWVVPNAIVAEFLAPALVTDIYRELMTWVPGVTAPAIDLPFRSAIRNRAVIASFGATKENVDLAYNGYTATMYTLARIHDIGNQFLRQSRGAAEADVMSELGAAFAQGESFYIREGTGSSQPFGYTSALTNGPSKFTTAFTASSTTLAGSMSTAIATASGVLAGRGVTPTAGVMSATSYWTMASQGTDSAGFFFAPAGGPNQVRPGTLLTPWGLPIYPDADADTEGTAAVIDNLVVADWKKFKVYTGQDYRVDSSDVAGTRWDTNLTGFRGEMEMAFDARQAVYAGYAQLIADITP